MAKRKGMGQGKGKGYKNIIGKDPMVHSQSAKGVKQPQNINLSFMELKKKGINLSSKGDADNDRVQNSKDCQPLNPNAQADMKSFNVKKGIDIITRYEKTRSGFRHTASLMVSGVEVDFTKIPYQNRTWERFEFESVIEKLLDKTDIISDSEKQKFLDKASGRSREEVEKKFQSIGAIAEIGNIFATTQKEKNVWKKRMLEAGLPELDVPDDWDTLSEKEKEKRLDKVISLMKKGGK